MIPGDIPWVVHRVATGGYYHDPIDTILTRWSLDDVAKAFVVCDALDAAMIESQKDP